MRSNKKNDARAESRGPQLPDGPDALRRRLPHLWTLFGGYFHQDADGSDDVIIDDYVTTQAGDEVHATIFELGELLDKCHDVNDLKAAVHALGSGRGPHKKKHYPQWLTEIAQQLQRYLDAVGYEPPDPNTPGAPEQRSLAYERAAQSTGTPGLAPIAASTYENEVDMQRFAQRVIDDYAGEILSWLRHAPVGSTKGFEMRDTGEVSGRWLSRERHGMDAGPQSVTGVRVVLKAHPDAKQGWYILETYPVG